MQQRFLDPSILAAISGLELLAKTVVDGFVAGLHRSPDFGFSQEFAEYRVYTPGDDLRHVDWNLYARTERAYLKRYRGETNSQLTILLDASGSMKFTSHKIEKLEYARFLAASLAYMASQQRDAAGTARADPARDRKRDAGEAHRFRASLSRVAGISTTPRRGGADFGFLGA